MRRRIRWPHGLLALIVTFAAWLTVGGGLPAQGPAPPPVVAVPNDDNLASQREKPYIVLVSLDGFRYDYARRYGTKTLLDMAAQGASAPDGMIPSFPSVTFPNHYTIVTGMYPDNHGIVENEFYDPQRHERFSFSDPKNATDGSWYGGTPLWVLAERQGMRAACFFWPGSETAISGTRPSYYLAYDGRVPDDRRVDQVLDWLKLLPEKRPHFITLYLSDADSAGHRTGTDSPETAAAVGRLDAALARLKTGLASLRLPINLIVVSDHGMVNVEGPWINLDQYADLRGFETVGTLLYPPDEPAAARVYSQLKGASEKFAVYRRKDVPEHLHFDYNLRIGDPVVIPNGPYLMRARNTGSPNETLPKGMHGYDPEMMKEMRSAFYAVGPAFKTGATLPPFENVNLYPMMANILGLQIGFIDGDLKVMQPVLAQAAGLPALRRPGALVPAQPQR
jgi:predicted AlkP superfamily pyrophosphatase or phosphodiesterase